jgi:hypothetical protein
MHFGLSLIVLGGLVLWLIQGASFVPWLEFLWSEPRHLFFYYIANGVGEALTTNMWPTLGLVASAAALLGMGREGRYGWRDNVRHLIVGTIAGFIFGGLGLVLAWLGWAFLVADNLRLLAEAQRPILLGLSAVTLVLSVLYGVSDSGVGKVEGFTRFVIQLVAGFLKLAFWLSVLGVGGVLGYNLVQAFGFPPYATESYVGAAAGAFVMFLVVRGLIRFIRSRLH